jgi:hypothetical protein
MMSTDIKLNTGQKIEALWDNFAHEVGEKGSVAIPVKIPDSNHRAKGLEQWKEEGFIHLSEVTEEHISRP